LKFIDDSPEPFHCVKKVTETLLKNGFIHIEESSVWSNLIQKGKKYFFTRNGSSVVAFIVGGKFIAGNGFKVVGAHTDRQAFF
jgi:aspartyl aminopeptidase